MNVKKPKLFTTVSSLLVASLLLTGSAFAASSVSGKMGTSSVSGSISLGTDQASGSTTCGASGCYTYVKVTYKYKHGDATKVREVTKEDSNTSYQINVTATADQVPARNVSATGFHRASDASYSWQGSTDVSA